ncbi:MAG: hypothetical protein IT429_00055 [Gemmataceae bacterium]|nr:hypothetical protein [Gemmataceae bacterium]
MTRTTLGVCASGWVLLVVGCASTDVAGMLFLGASGDERLVAGSLETVAQATRDRLVKLDVQAELSKQGEAFHIACTTTAGQRFRLILTSEKAGNAEKTRIRLEWVGDRNDGLTLQILGRLEHVTGQ